jgi:hypothetical protein
VQLMHHPHRITVCQALAGAVRIVVLVGLRGCRLVGACWYVCRMLLVAERSTDLYFKERLLLSTCVFLCPRGFYYRANMHVARSKQCAGHPGRGYDRVLMLFFRSVLPSSWQLSPSSR